MNSPLRIADFAGKRVAIWGFGREGKAAIAAIRSRLPALPLTLFCSVGEADAARTFDATLTVRGEEPDAVAFAPFDVVVKSPGISAYKPALLAARESGIHVTSGTALWFAENPHARVVAVTGTKGKSTTTALLAHLARSLGVRTALAGNIGMPLLELLGQSAELWAIELSSFQTGEAGPVELGVITSLYEEHLDWHGSRERYIEDKLKLASVSTQLLVNATQASLLERTAGHPHRIVFGSEDGWHVAGGFIGRGTRPVFDASALRAPGEHNALNACAALAALEAMGFDAVKAAPALATFRPLPHRLQPLGEHDGFHWINDSISTTPQATLAALGSLVGQAVTVIVGGHDRGLDWHDFVAAMKAHAPHAIVAQGSNGPRIARALREAGVTVEETTDLATAVARARALTPPGGTILLSPGAPSFDQFHDYADRGQRFAEMAGFDAHDIVGIEGLGIA
ncbi:UDP-N-acetylmuramoylalanine--D-glutamate ligase [Dyella jiangningensis]|uniref:UDP-N-acetylmuramoyl-L-alanine--D-glutamate ligase n=1 Tax=Dyella sp. AtDHG13 TaxID=1938897 RepID=UPI00088757EE|nr:UDP-N-acetylmuramoyl-L-alanine--D-glutamate ligase [Dyella sp. AtDHG13]PXV54695.1 UDP-N-acetylmuramoylalanine--D-glutamate ligase [Dyella sp. AtDHG13]SDK88338.1 UDP-N-acetylmuramoylalanine--D-glutamate ligase [Dyella jiangningensis]